MNDPKETPFVGCRIWADHGDCQEESTYVSAMYSLVTEEVVGETIGTTLRKYYGNHGDITESVQAAIYALDNCASREFHEWAESDDAKTHEANRLMVQICALAEKWAQAMEKPA